MKRVLVSVCLSLVGLCVQAGANPLEEGFAISEVVFTGCASAEKLIVELAAENQELITAAEREKFDPNSRTLAEQVNKNLQWSDQASRYIQLCACHSDWALLSHETRTRLVNAGCQE